MTIPIERIAHPRGPAVAIVMLAVSLLAAPSAALASPDAPAATEVRIAQGILRGRAGEGKFASFLDVPYAAAPVGPLRWRMPQPPSAWSGARDATRFGPACAQDASGFGGAFDRNQSEDCLALNIWTPALKPAKRLPVMLYIHGGGFVGGAGAVPTFDGTALARHGVVVVTINYRLGVLGFLAHPELTRESAHKSSGNYGLGDQLAALRWVQANIAEFGGDPSRVTIFGQSAGAISVMDLMTSPQGRGLIHGAIAESGTPLLRLSRDPDMTLAQAEAQGSAFGAELGGKSLAELRALPAGDIMKRWNAFAAKTQGRTWPIIDGYVLPKPPAEVFAERGELAIPLMTGSNAREGFGPPKETELPDRLRLVFGAAADRAIALYPRGAPADPILGTSAEMFATDTSFRCPAIAVQTSHAQKGAPTYAYQFEETIPGREAMGSQHSDEVSYVFGTLDMLATLTRGTRPSAAQQRLSDRIVNYWANFAKTGDPNGPGLPAWPRFTPRSRAFVHLNAADIRSDTHLRSEVCALVNQQLSR